MTDIVERLRDGEETCGIHRCITREARSGCTCAEAADEIERLREALRKIEYLDSPQVRGLPRRVSIHEIARAALGENE